MPSPSGASRSADRQSKSGNNTSLGAQMPQLTQNNNKERSMDLDPLDLLDEPSVPQAPSEPIGQPGSLSGESELRAKVAAVEDEWRAKMMALVKAAAQAAEEAERHFQAVRQENKELRVENESLRAKTQSFKLTCDDLKPKIGKLQAVIQRARRTREAFVHRQQEIKHLSRFNHKEQQLLTALAKIVEDELQED